MIRIFLLLGVSLFISGCASNVIHQVNLRGVSEANAVTLVSDCDSTCENYIEEKFQVETSFDIMSGRDVVKYVILSEIDGVRGRGVNYDPSGAFNSEWDGGFTIKTSPGLKKLVITPTSTHMAPKQTREISFETHSSKTYLVAQLHSWRKYKGIQINEWSPLVVDLESREIIIPSGEPIWNKYCFRAAEFGGYRQCPDESR